MGYLEVGQDKDQAVAIVLKSIRDLNKKLGIQKNIKELGAKPEDFPTLVANAMTDACGFTNPHQPTNEEVLGLFQAAYDQEY
mmetsp:Transcript_71993/g.181986  ORF Transcript_71993/g.181986 Transcript_71993/m.181986 type:complete len:82 (-) Transcript_71993:188-433(-)